MTPERIDELRALAEAATPGERTYVAYSGRHHPELVRWGTLEDDGDSGFANFSYDNHTNEAKLFAALTREVVLSLLDELKKYETCKTCDGDGIMDVTVSVNSMGEEQYDPEICAECAGVGICAFAMTIKERDQFREFYEAGCGVATALVIERDQLRARVADLEKSLSKVSPINE